MFTTAGVTFLTISENPCVSPAGTPAAKAVDSLGRTVNAKVLMTRPIPATRPKTSPPLLRVTITAFLHKVNRCDTVELHELNGALYTISSEGFKD
jgi:hypothetical protein